MHELNQEKIAFITPHEVFCYKVMLFRLKNIGATYQRMITKIFDLIMCKKETNHVRDLIEVIAILKKHKLRLNAAKCTYGVRSGKFLGHLVMRRVIETNPELA